MIAWLAIGSYQFALVLARKTFYWLFRKVFFATNHKLARFRKQNLQILSKEEFDVPDGKKIRLASILELMKLYSVLIMASLISGTFELQLWMFKFCCGKVSKPTLKCFGTEMIVVGVQFYRALWVKLEQGKSKFFFLRRQTIPLFNAVFKYMFS